MINLFCYFKLTLGGGGGGGGGGEGDQNPKLYGGRDVKRMPREFEC